MIPKSKEFSDETNADNWNLLLKRFNTIADSEVPVKAAYADLLAIKNDAMNCKPLTLHQAGAIIAHVGNYLAGNYGNTKKNILSATKS